MLNDFLRDKRVKKGLTQKEVADALGYTTSQFVSNWERGLSAPPLNALTTLVDLYALNPKELMTVILTEHERELRSVLLEKRRRRRVN